MRRTLLIVSQVYVPDPAAVGQYLADVAGSMARRGWRVVVLTSACGYDDPSIRYRKRDVIDGVEIVRLPLSSFGKGSIAVRLMAQSLFLLQAIVRGALVRGLGSVLISTSPPMASLAGWGIACIRRVPVRFWVMDVNPDQVVAMGKVRQKALPVRVFDWMNRLILRRATDVVVLDRFMAERVNRKLDVSSKLTILPPWPLETHLRISADVRDGDAFRRQHGLEGKFVVMYSGNHSPANPLQTLIDAAKQLQRDERFVFLFVGAGHAKRDVERAIAEGCGNIRSLPYQPLERLGDSLAAADVHAASIGQDLVGIVHPSKIYGAMSVGRPLITFGPPVCHLAELVQRFRIGYHVEHGDVNGAVEALEQLAALPQDEVASMRQRAREGVAEELNQDALRGEFCRLLGAQSPVRVQARNVSVGATHPAREATPPSAYNGFAKNRSDRTVSAENERLSH